MKKIVLSVDGMTCSACSNGLEKYLNKQKGIVKASVNLVLACAEVEYDDSLLSAEQIEKFVAEAGFKSLGTTPISSPLCAPSSSISSSAGTKTAPSR